MNLFLRITILQIIFAILVFAEIPSLEIVSLKLHWKQHFEFAGYFMARKRLL